MRVLVTWGTKRGGTEGIARTLSDTLRAAGVDTVLTAAAQVRDLDGVDAVIVGGALYANRWHGTARRFVTRNLDALRRRPVWFFSSGPLDDSAARAPIPPTPQVKTLMERVGALGHMTFGGRLAPDAHGFPAAAMAKSHSGDWRDPAHIQAWATELAHALPTARPGRPLPIPARAPGRVFAHAFLGWAACAVLARIAFTLTSPQVALIFHAAITPLIFLLVGWSYFRPPGARAPLPTALAFGAVGIALELAVAGAVTRSLAAFGTVTAVWLPVALAVLATWAAGGIASMRPFPRPAPR